MNLKMRGFRCVLVLLVISGLAGCGAFGQSTPAPLPTVVLEGESSSPQPSASSVSGGGVTASGIVAPAEEAQMVFAAGGKVDSVEVAVGAVVTEGQVLVRLSGGVKLAAAVEAANLELLAAQQARDELYQNLDAARNTALQALNSARQAVRDAEKRLANLSGVADSADIDIAHTQLILAEKALKDAQEKYGRFKNLPEDNLARARYRVVVAEAQKKYDQALRKYNSLTGSTNSFDRQQAETDLEIANKQLELAQKDSDQLQQGPDPDQVEAAEARIQNAQAQLEASQATLADLELKAPFSGTVGKLSVHSGEWVVPGQPVLRLVDLEHLQIQTTDLSERDVPKIEVGQPVRVFVKALNQELAGHVSAISPLADTLGGDVVYQTTIDLETLPPELRAGMSVEVSFEE